MDEKKHQSRPPSAPKPSRTNHHGIERRRQLKDRLKLRWNQPQPLYAAARIDPSLAVKGYGEIQFADSHYEGDRIDLEHGGSESLWADSTVFPGDGAAAIATNDRPLAEPFQRVREISRILSDQRQQQQKQNQKQPLIQAQADGLSQQAVGSVASYQLTHQSIHRSTLLTHSLAEPSTASAMLSSQPAVMGATKSSMEAPEEDRDETSRRTVVPYSHLEVSRSLAEKGVEGVAESLVLGQTGFCYVENTTGDFYSFGIRSDVPDGLSENRYMTMSQFGILRSLPGEGELISFADLERERLLYRRLIQLSVFKYYRLWKPFLLWRKHVRGKKFVLVKNELEERLLTTHDFNRKLLLEARTRCLAMESLTIFCLDHRDFSKSAMTNNTIDFEAFIALQKVNNDVVKAKVGKIREDLVDQLTRECEGFICQAAQSTPAALSHEKYQAIKLTYVNNYQEIVQAAEENHNLLQSAIHLDTPPPPADLGEGDASMGSPRDGKVQAVIENTLDSMSTVSHYIYNTTNLGAMGSNIYNVKYTQELLDDQSIISSYATSPVNAIGSGSSVAARRRNIEEMKKSQRKAKRSPGDGVDTGDHVNPAAAAAAAVAPTHVSYSVRAAIRLVCRKIYHVYRIVDYMMRDLLYDKLKGELDLLIQLLSSSFDHYADQLQANGAISTGYDKAFPIIEEEPSSVNLFTKKDTSRNMKSKLATLFFRIALTISEFDYSNPSNSNNNKGTHSPTVTIASTLRDIDGNKLLIKEENIEKITLLLHPNMENCIDEFLNLLRDTCQTCVYTDGLLQNKKCLDILRPVLNEIAVFSMEDRVLVDADQGSEVQTLINNCTLCLHKSFNIITSFVNYLQLYKREFTQNISKLVLLDKNKLTNVPSEDIMQDYSLWDQRLSSYSSLFVLYNIGVFYIDLSKLKLNLLDNVNHCVAVYNKQLPELLLTHGDSLYKDISRYIDRLGRSYNSLDDYIKNVEVFNLLNKKQDEITDNYNYLLRLKEIVDLRSIKISDEILRQSALLGNLYTKLNLLIVSFGDAFESQVKLFRSEIQNRLRNIIVPIQELQDYLFRLNAEVQELYGKTDHEENDHMWLRKLLFYGYSKFSEKREEELLSQESETQPDAPLTSSVTHLNVEKAISDLLRYKSAIMLISSQLQTLDYYQQLLGVSVFEYGLQLEIQKELNATILLLNNFVIVRELYSSLLATNYVDINFAVVMKEVHGIKIELEDSDYFMALKDVLQNRHEIAVTQGKDNELAGTVHHLHHGTSDDLTTQHTISNHGIFCIYEMIFKIIHDVELYMSIISMLQSKALTTKHQIKINHLLQYNVFDVSINNTTSTVATTQLHQESDYTLAKLIDTVNIPRYWPELSIIHHEAMVTFNLKNKIDLLVQQLLGLELVFSTELETTNKSQVYLTNYHTLLEDLVDLDLSFISLSNSSHGAILLAELYPELLQQVKEDRLYLTYFQTVQSAYNKYKLLFVSARSARHLSAYMKNYKIVDDGYRNLVKAARSDIHLHAFIHSDKNTTGLLEQCLEHVNSIEKGFKRILRDFCEKYPKLYLIHDNVFYQSFLLTSLKDVVMLLTPYLFQSMNITQVEFDGNDDSNVLSVTSSYLERVAFHKTCSARNNLYDFFKLMDMCIHDKLERDIKELIVTYLDEEKALSLVDEIKNNHHKYSSQALLLIFQIQFWNNFWKQFTAGSTTTAASTAAAMAPAMKSGGGYSRSVQSRLKSFMLELQDSINILYTIYTEPVSQYGIQLTSDFIITLLYYRDLLKEVLAEYNLSWDHELNAQKEISKVIQGISLVFCNIQKYVEGYYPYNVNCYNLSLTAAGGGALGGGGLAQANSSAAAILHNIYLSVGGEKVKYGLKYNGYNQRLAVHPVVDKFYFTMMQTFSSHSVAYLTNPINTTSTHSVGSVDLLQSLSMELGQEQFFYHLRDLSLYTHNSLLFHEVENIQYSNANNSKGRGAIGGEEEEGSHCYSSNISQFNRLVRAAMKSGLWVTLINNDRYHEDPQDHEMATTLLSYISSALSVIYQELHNRNKQYYQPDYLNNIREYQSGYNKVMIKHELFGGGGVSVDHGLLNQMKFVVMNSHLPSATLFASQVFPSSHLFRPLTIPTVNLKIVLNILLSSFNFIYINKLSERLEQLVSFLIHHNYANYHLLKYLLIQTVRSIGNHGDHLVVNVSTQLTLIIKKFLNNLPSTILQRLQGTGDIKLIYNLFLELVYDPAKDGKDLYINTYYSPTMTYEEELVARLWDCTSNAGYGTQNQSNAQLHNNTVNQNIFHNDIQAIATYNRPPQTPESYSAALANASSAAAIAATTIYKRSILVLGNAGVGKTELVFRALNTMKTKYNQEDKNNIRILPYVLNPLLIAGDADGTFDAAPKREEKDPPPVPLVPTVEKNMIPLQKYIQNFLNMDHTQQITMNIIYFDVTSYRESFQMMHEIIQYVNIFYRLHRVKLIFESVNISDMDPYFITQFDILHISKPIFTVEELLEKHLVQCLESESSIFRRVVEESFHALIKPTILFVLSEIPSHQQAMAALYIIPHMFTLLTTLYHHYVFPLTSFGFVMPNPAAAAPQNSASKSTSSTIAHKNSSLLHNSFMGNLPRNFVMVNKPYKLPSISFDEDSLRRLVLYGLLWTCGSCSSTFYLGANSLEDHQKRLEHFIRHRLPNTVESFPYKKVIPSHEQVSLFDQFLCPRIQSEGHGINTTSSAAVNAGMNATPVLEWTVIDEKYISSALQKKPIISHGAGGRGGGSQHSLNDAVLFSNLSWSYHQTNQIYVPNPLSLNLSYIQSSYALILPIHFQSTVQNQVNPLFRHNYNNLYNIFGCRGMLISGEVGSGRRSLLRQLLADLVEMKVSASNRWLVHTSLRYSNNDQSRAGSSLSSYILEAQQSLAQKRYEQNVLNIGAIFIEDVNLDLLYQNHQETNALRHLLQFNTVFDSSKQQYRVYNSFYIAAMTQRSSGRQVRAEDHRLGRLFHNVQIPPSNTVQVLTHYFERQLGMLHQDICFDLTHVLYSFFRDLQDVVLFIEMKRKDLTFHVDQRSVPIVSQPLNGNAPPGTSTGSSEVNDREGIILKMFEAIIDRQPTILERSMDLFYPLLVYPASVQSKEIIDQMILALHTFHNVTSEVDQVTMASVGVLDFLAVFDRILCDHINRLIQIPHLYDVYNTVLDYTINHSVPVYRYNNMLGLLEKLRMSRVANYDSILSNPSNHMTAWEPLSYTRCISGFYKTGSNILPILLTAEFVRDAVLKKVCSKMVALMSENDLGHGINLQILTDFKFRDHVATFIPSTTASTDNNSTLSTSALLLLAAVYEYGKIYRNDQSFWHDILRMVTVWTSSYPCSYFLVRSPCLIYNSIGNDGQVKNVVHRSDFTEYVYPRVLLAMQYFHHTSYEVIDLPHGFATKQASAPQQGKQDGIDFQYANFTNCVKKICHFLQDDFVLYGIYHHIQALASGEVKTLITKEVINYLSIVLSNEDLEALKAVESKYRLIPQNLSYYEKKAAGATAMSQVGHKIHSLVDVTVWCIHFNSMNSSWQNYLEDLSFQSAYMTTLLAAINPRLNAQLYQEMNDIILHYNHRQKVLLLDEDPQEAKPLSAVCTVSSSGPIPQTTSSAITQLSSSFFYTIYEYPLYSDYSIMDELLERFLVGFIFAQRALPQQSHSPEVALGASMRDKEEQDKEDREHLHALLIIIDDFVSLCTEEVVVHYSYPTTVLGEKRSKAHQDEPDNPFDYIRNELKMMLLQQIQKFVLRYHKLCLEEVKKSILGMMNKYVMYNFQPAFFQTFVSSLRPVDLLCLLVFNTFYHSILPARYLHLPLLRHYHNLTKIQHFLITHLPSFHPLEDDVLPINEKKTGLALEGVLEYLDGLNIIFNLVYPAFESSVSNLLPSYMHATMAMVYTIPSSRMCKSHLLAVHHTVCTSARIRLEDRTLLGSLLIAKLLQLDSAENDCKGQQIHFHANCLVSTYGTFPCVGAAAPFDKSGGEVVVQVLLSQYEYLADYLLLLLLERNMLGPVASELQSLYLHRKEDFRTHLFSPGNAIEVIGGGAKISSSSGLGRLNASSINHTKHMSERFNGLYSEMVHKILQPMENLMLVFTNVMAIYEKQGQHNEQEAVRILQGLFDEFLVSLIDYLNMTKTGSSAKESLTYSLEEILSLATWKLLDSTLPNILPSPASMNTVLMNIVMDYVFLDYHEPNYVNSKFLLEQRCQLLQLIKDLYHLEYGGGRSDKDESNIHNYNHSHLDKKFGIILLHKDEIKAEAAAERKEEEDSASALPSPTTPRKRRKSRFFRGMPSFDERDDQSDDSDSQSDGDSSDSLTEEDSQEDEVFLLANHSRRVFHQMLLMVAHLFTTNTSSINNFYLKYIHKSKASANVSSCLAILDEMHDEIDVYVDFSEEIYSPNLVFPNAAGYSMTILDKFLLCLVVKVNVVGVFCRDIIVRHGSGLDISQGKYRHFISPEKDKESNLDQVNVLPPMMDPVAAAAASAAAASSSPPRLSRMSMLANQQNDAKQEEVIRLRNIRSATDLLYQLHVYHTNHKPFPPGPAAFPSPPPSPSHFNIYLCHGHVNLSIVMDYILQNNREIMLANVAAGWIMMNDGNPALSRMGSRTASMRKMSIGYPGEEEPPSPAGSPSPPMGKMLRTSSMLGRTQSFMGAVGDIANSNSLGAIYSRHITTLFYDNSKEMTAENWVDHLIRYIVNMKTVFDVHPILYVVCLKEISPSQHHWQSLKQFVVKERMNIILSSPQMTIQDVKMNSCQGLDLSLISRTRNSSMDLTQSGPVVTRRSFFGRRSLSSSRDAEDSLSEEKGKMISSLGQMNGEGAESTGEKGLRPSLFFSYHSTPPLHFIHLFDGPRVADRIAYYVHMMSQLTYLIDTNTANKLIICWPAQIPPNQQQELLRISKWVINRVRWLLVFLHIALVYNFEVARYAGDDLERMNDNLLFHANQTIERLWLNTLNAVLVERYANEESAENDPNHLVAASSDSSSAPVANGNTGSTYRKRIGGGPPFSLDSVVDEIVCQCYERFDEIALHHVLLLLIYYPFLHGSLVHHSVMDELQVKYIFENIFTSRSAVYTSSYYVLNQVLLPREINIYKHNDVAQFCATLNRLLSKSDNQDSSEAEESGSDEDDKGASTATDGGMLLLDLLFVTLPQTSTKTIYLLQTDHTFPNYPGVIDLASTQHAAPLSSLACPIEDRMMELGSCLAGRLQDMVLLHLEHILRHLLNSLSPLIDLENDPEIQENAEKFRLKKDLEQMKGRNTMVAIPGGLGSHAGGGPASLHTIRSRRKGGQRMLLQFQARDYDSLWMHMLAEASSYNAQLKVVRQHLQQLQWACRSRSHLACFFSALRKHHLSVEFMMEDMMKKLPMNQVPAFLLSYEDGVLRALPVVTIDQYLQLWQDRHQQLLRYLRSGNMNNVKLHLLHNLPGLFFALKESFAMKTESSIDKIFLHYDLCSLSQHNKFINSNQAALNNVHRVADAKENFGCNVRAVDLSLFQARIGGPGAHSKTYTSGNNCATLRLEFLPPCSQASFGSEVVLHIFPSLVEQSMSNECYLCPLFVSAFPALPSLFPTESEEGSPNWKDNRQQQATCWVPINTVEDTIECALSRIALYSKPSFIVPV